MKLARNVALIKELEARVQAAEGKNRDLSQKLTKAEADAKMAQK